MSKSDNNSVVDSIVRVVTAILVVLLILGIAGGIIYLINRPQGMYIEYDGTTYDSTSASDGVSVPYNSEITFTICNSSGWGVYSVQDCTVKIIPNVDDSHDFEFTVIGNSKPSLYSSESDLSAAFCDSYDGNGIAVSSDGTFTITTYIIDMSEILNAVYTEGVTMDGEYTLRSYPYVALYIVSPDGSESLTIPLYVDIDGLQVNKVGIVF